MIYIDFLGRSSRSRLYTVLGWLCIALIVGPIVADSLGGGNSPLSGCLGSLGAGLSSTLLGVAMVRLLPDEPRFWDLWRAQAPLGPGERYGNW